MANRAMIENDMDEEAKQFGLRFTLYGEDFCFVSELPVDFHTAIQVYCEKTRKEVGETTLDSIDDYCPNKSEIDSFSFSALCSDMPHDNQITAVYDFNFDDNTIKTIDNHGDSIRVFDLDDIYDAYTHAVENAGARCSEWHDYFDSYISGKEIDIDDEAEAPTMQM